MELLNEEFSSETLREALEFIDACELTSSSDDYDSSSASDFRVRSPEPDSLTQKEAPATQSCSLKRRSSKNELERLRKDVQTLTAKLARVKRELLRSKRATTESVAADDEAEMLWMDMAVVQHRRRHHSEATNRQFKRSIAKQLKVGKYLEALISRRSLVEDREASYDPFLSDFRHFQSHSQDDQLVFANLLIHSQQLYMSADSHMQQAGLLLVNSLATHTQRKHHPEQGAIYETLSSTHVPFSVQQTDDTIWNGFFKGQVKDRPGVNDYVLTEDGLRKSYLATYQHQRNTYDLHSRTVMRKYSESGRLVYTWTTLTVLACKGLRFYAQAMVVMQPSPTLPQSASVMKKWLRVRGERIDPSKVSVEVADGLVDGILKTLGKKTATTWAWLENTLLGYMPAVPPCAPFNST